MARELVVEGWTYRENLDDYVCAVEDCGWGHGFIETTPDELVKEFLEEYAHPNHTQVVGAL